MVCFSPAIEQPPSTGLTKGTTEINAGPPEGAVRPQGVEMGDDSGLVEVADVQGDTVMPGGAE